jgi:hypothetical protein
MSTHVENNQPAFDNKFFFDSRQIYAALKDKGIEYLFHANTVTTSMTFIQSGALLSRSHVESNQLYQTDQKSDIEDKTYNVWDDVFIDGLDLHEKYKRANHYGPVLFVLKLDMLLSPSVPRVLITKNNPMYWKPGQTWDDRYYSNIDDFKKDYLGGEKLDSRMMFTFRGMGNSIKFNKFLDHIVFDNPEIIVMVKKESIEVGKTVHNKLEALLKEFGLGHIPVLIRHQGKKFPFCKCVLQYNHMANFSYKIFKERFKTNPAAS